MISRHVKRLTRIFSALSSVDRLRILYCLASGPKSVSDIRAVVKKSPSLLSYDLSAMEKSGLVNSRKVGRHVIYSLVHNITEPVLRSVEEFGFGAVSEDDSKIMNIMRERFRTLATLSASGLFMVRDGLITYANHSGAAMAGYKSPKLAIGKRISGHVRDKDGQPYDLAAESVGMVSWTVREVRMDDGLGNFKPAMIVYCPITVDNRTEFALAAMYLQDDLAGFCGASNSVVVWQSALANADACLWLYRSDDSSFSFFGSAAATANLRSIGINDLLGSSVDGGRKRFRDMLKECLSGHVKEIRGELSVRCPLDGKIRLISVSGKVNALEKGLFTASGLAMIGKVVD